MKTIDFSGRVALVTGGGSGIGRATARGFAECGARVAILDHDNVMAEEAAQLVVERGGEALVFKTDVSDEASVAKAIATVVEEYGRLDAAHNNAGISPDTGSTVDCTRELWDRIFAVNTTGVWLCMKYEIQAMLGSGGGAIVNTGSVSSLRAAPYISAYVASKHALVGLTKVTALEYAEQGIRVNLVCPGVVRTPMLEKKADEGFFSIDEYVQGSVPMKRTGASDEIASAVVWACSEQASYLTGATLSVDGGMVIA